MQTPYEEPPPLHRDYNLDPNIKSLKGGCLLIMGLHYILRRGPLCTTIAHVGRRPHLETIPKRSM